MKSVKANTRRAAKNIIKAIRNSEYIVDGDKDLAINDIEEMIINDAYAKKVAFEFTTDPEHCTKSYLINMLFMSQRTTLRDSFWDMIKYNIDRPTEYLF